MVNYISVQQDKLTWDSSTSSQTITLDTAVDTAHSFIICYATANNSNQDTVQITAKFNTTGTSVDQIVIERYSSPSSSCSIYYAVVSADPNAPTPAFEVIASNEISFASGDTTKTETVSGLLDTDVIITQARTTASMTDNRGRALVAAKRSAADTLELDRDDTGTAIVCRYYVVRFSSDFNVYDYSLTQTGNNDSTTITSVDTSRTSLFVNWSADSNGLAQTSPYVELASSTSVTTKRETTQGTVVVNFWVVEWPSDVNVEHGLTEEDKNSASWTIALASDVNTDYAFLTHTNGCTGTGTAFPRTNVIHSYGSTGVAFWKMEDSGGDDAWGSHYLTLSNVSVVTGYNGNAYSFNGTSSRADGDNSTLINTLDVSVRTYSLWFKANDTSSRQTLWKEGGTTNSGGIYLYNDSLYFAWGANQSLVDYMTTTFTDTSSWHHLFVVLDTPSGASFMMLDGVEVDTSTATTNMPNHAGAWSIGWSNGHYFVEDGTTVGNGVYYDGLIDEFRIWNFTKPSSDGEAIYNGTYTDDNSASTITFEALYTGQTERTAWFSVDTTSWTFEEATPTVGSQSINSESYLGSLFYETFEDGNISNNPTWSINSGSPYVTSTESHTGGSSLTFSGGFGENISIDRSNPEPRQGTWTTWVNPQSNSTTGDFYQLMDSNGSYASIGYYLGSFGLSDGTGFISGVGLSLGSWYKFELDCTTPGSYTANVYDTGESLIGSTNPKVSSIQDVKTVTLLSSTGYYDNVLVSRRSSLVNTYDTTITTNITIQKSQAETITSDFTITKLLSELVTSNTNINKQFSDIITSSGIIQKTQTSLISSNSIIKKSFNNSITSDSIISIEATESITSKSHINKTSSQFIVSNLTILKTNNSNISTAVVLTKQYDENIVSNSIIQKSVLENIVSSVYINKQYTENIQSNSWLNKTRIDTIVSDAFVKEEGQILINSNVVIRKLGIVESVFSDTVISKTNNSNVTSDCYIVNTITSNINSNSVVRKTREFDIVSNTTLQVTNLDTIGVDVTIVRLQTVGIVSDTNILFIESSNIISDSVVRSLEQSTITSQSNISISNTSTVNTNVHILATQNFSIDSETIITKTQSDSIHSSSEIIEVQFPTITSNVVINKTINNNIISNTTIILAGFEGVYTKPKVQYNTSHRPEIHLNLRRIR